MPAEPISGAASPVSVTPSPATPSAESAGQMLDQGIAGTNALLAPSSSEIELGQYNVVGRDKGSQTALRMDVPVKDIPATVQVVSSEDMQEHASTDWVSALNYTSGVTAMSTYGGLDQATVRGLPGGDLVLLYDGVRDDTLNVAGTWAQGNLAGVDSIQILKGPASMLYGSGALAGVMNIVHKQPTDFPQVNVDLAYGSFNTRDLALGAGGPIDGTSILYRLDIASHSTDGFRQNPDSSLSASGALQMNPWDGATLSYRLDVDHNHIGDPDPGIPTLKDGQIPGDFPLNLNYGNPNDFIDLQAARNAVTLRQDFGPHWYVSTEATYQQKDYEYLESEQLTLQADEQTINRAYLWFKPNYSSYLSQTELGWDLDGLVPQKGMVGYSFNYWEYATEYDSALNYNADPADNVNLYTGGMAYAPAIDIVPTTEQWNSQLTNGVYGQDFLTVTPWAKVLLAGRFDSYRRAVNTDSFGTPTTSTESEAGEAYDTYNSGNVTRTANSAPTWRAGLVLSPLDSLNLYTTYTTAFIPAPIETAVVAGTPPTVPETGHMWETGAKWDTPGDRFSGTAAYFQEGIDNLVFKVATEPGVGTIYSQDDTFSSQGIDLQMDSRVSDNFRIKGGYTYIDASQNKYSGGVWINGRPSGVPMNTANIWGILGLGYHLSLGLGARYVGLTYISSVTETTDLPAYIVVDSGLYFKPNHFWGVDLVVNNLLNNRSYFISDISESGGPQLYPGNPQDTTLSLHLNF